MRTLSWIILLLFVAAVENAAASSLTEQDLLRNLEMNTRLAQTVTVADLVTYAYLNNPSILSAKEAWKATVEKYRLATGYPDPQFSATYFPEPIETRLGPQDWKLDLSQVIPFPGKLSKAGEIVQVEARIAKLGLDKAVRDVTVSIRESFHEFSYIRKAKQVTGKNIQLLDHLRKIAETAYAGDRAIFFDVVKAQAQSGQLRYDALLLDELEMTEQTRLNGLLDRDPDAGFGRLQGVTFKPLVYSVKEIYRLAEEHQEEIQMARTQVEKADTKLDLARYENLPDFKVGMTYSAIGNPDVSNPPSNEGRDAFGVQFGLTVPLWFGKNKGRVGRALAEKEQAKAIKTLRINETQTRIRELFFRLENARRIMELYGKELLPQAAKSMEIAETWFRQGESSFSDFIETQAVWYNFQLAYARARADYGKYLARLEGLVGQNLTQKNEAAADSTGKDKK
ncbi:Heavy metal RND efflux outer membrane protein, CzcC family [Olavius algarvensis Delta 1 endosymbiont]|nr:Heavy metal RND efflux outer membrane protein, CzcC family [Olavius algarvensis Delta 1 endosymbiont]